MDWLCNRTLLLVFTVGAVIKSTLQDTTIEPVVPARVEVCSGANATINCTFSAGSGHLKVKWLFKSDSSESCIDVHGEHYHHKHEETWSELTIIKVTLNDSGLYICEVTQDIPRLVTSLSNGSQLNVIDSHTPRYPEHDNITTEAPTVCASTTSDSSSSSAWLVWTASSLGVVVLVIAAVIIWSLFCRKKESPVYENTKCVQKDRSPRPRMPAEKGKTSKQTDTMKSHNYTYRPHGRGTQLNL